MNKSSDTTAKVVTAVDPALDVLIEESIAEGAAILTVAPVNPEVAQSVKDSIAEDAAIPSVAPVEAVLAGGKSIKPRSYSDLIKEVYIDQIRSAIIVDDSYPTLELLLSSAGAVEAEKLSKSRDFKSLLSIVQACRSHDKPWLVDVHDGVGLETDSVANDHFKRLHQSDLMILDYSLDGDNSESNLKVCNVLKSLASNNYFNLVIIYTKCSDTELLQRVLNLAQCLTHKSAKYGSDEPITVPKEFQEWEDESGVNSNLKKALHDELTLPIFLNLIQEENANWEHILAGTKLGALFDSRAVPKEKYFVQTLSWIIRNKYKDFSSALSDRDFGKVEFDTNNINWIRTNTLFVTVISKTVNPTELPNELLKALEASNPSPHRLLMTKIRTVLDEKGVIAERSILNKKLMQAGWLKEMLQAMETDERDWKVKRTISHHWEELANHVSPEIKSYANDLLLTILELENNKINNIIQRYTKINIADPSQLGKVIQEWNSYVCSKEVDGHHLMTGHILEITTEIKDQVPVVEFWVCLTPICDLVPRDGNKIWAGQQIIEHNVIPFKAVKLHEWDSKKGLKDANKNDYIFIGTGDDLKCFRYSASSTASPIWNQFFAINSGKFGSDRTLNLNSVELVSSSDGLLSTRSHKAKLTNQLRYEYALHLLQKLGGNFSRIGLEFIKH